MILVRGCGKVRQDWRVEFACGKRAERLATEDFERQRLLTGSLACAMEELPQTVEKLAAERDANFKSLRQALQGLAEVRAKQMVAALPESAAGVRLLCEVLRGVHAEFLSPLATEIAKNERAVALLAIEESGQLVFAQHPAAGKDLAGVLKNVLASYPGKGGGSKDFVRAKLAEPGSAGAAIELASQLIAG